MSETTTPSTKSELINANHIIDSLEFRTGVSPKTGNDYIIGILKIKTKRGRPYAMNLAYLDDNAIGAVEDSLEHFAEQEENNEKAKQDFQKDFKK